MSSRSELLLDTPLGILRRSILLGIAVVEVAQQEDEAMVEVSKRKALIKGKKLIWLVLGMRSAYVLRL